MPYRRSIDDFARRIGMNDWRCDDLERAPAVFRLEGLGTLTLEPGPRDTLLMSLATPLPPYEDAPLLEALRRCHPDRVTPFPLACGLARDQLVLMSRLPRGGLTAAALENVALFLIRQANEIDAGVPA